MEQQASIKKYVMIFSALYTGFMVFFLILAVGFELDLGSGATIGTLFGSALGTASLFLKNENRAPTKSESRALTLGSLVLLFIISIAVTFIATAIIDGSEGVDYLIEIYSALTAVAWLLIISVAALIHYLVLILIYGWMSRKMFENQSKAKAAA